MGTAAGRAHQAFAPRALELAETFPFGFFLSEGATRKLAGAKFGGGTGAAAGFLTGGPVGAVIGGIGGALGGAGLCIIVTACSDNYEEIALAKRYRAKHMSRNQLKGYYCVSDDIVEKMEHDIQYRSNIRTRLVEPLLRVGAERLGEEYGGKPSDEDKATAVQFLSLLERIGSEMPYYQRKNGEII